MEKNETLEHLTALGDYWHDQYLAADRAMRYAAEQMDVIGKRIELLKEPVGEVALAEVVQIPGQRNFRLIQGGLSGNA